MERKFKKCEQCGKNFNIKGKNRIVLEFWKDSKHLSRVYFCGRQCFVSFLKQKGLV
ncbi:MAG: hypothetical protein U9N35_02705 [Euryarchaeota archaeon]|nr:hypothetical protein [Euryarchaeota archaeon]